MYGMCGDLRLELIHIYSCMSIFSAMFLLLVQIDGTVHVRFRIGYDRAMEMMMVTHCGRILCASDNDAFTRFDYVILLDVRMVY